MVHPWQLDDFYRRIRAVVLDLEQAFLEGTLKRRLEHADVREVGGQYLSKTYLRLMTDEPTRLSPLRVDAVRSLLEQVRLEIFAVENQGSATLIPQTTARPDGESDLLPIVRATLQGRAAHLRLDQFLASRSWGIGFDFDLPEASDAFATLIARNAAKRLAYDLRSLQMLLAHFEPRQPTASLRIVPRPRERAFERLMLDILNEHEPLARFASLGEDFLGKVDLHIKLLESDGARDAPIQVTQITDPVRYQEKLSKIRLLDQMVILSPRSLTSFLIQQMNPDRTDSCLSRTEQSAIWASIEDRPTTTDELATSIKRILLRALRLPINDPLGPMAHVPPAARGLVRAFVQQDAARALRTARDAATDVSDGLQRTSTFILEIPNQLKLVVRRVAQRLGIAHYSRGHTVTGVVTNIMDYGLFINLGEAYGLLHVSCIPPSDEPLRARFTKGQKMQVTIRLVDDEKARIELTLPPPENEKAVASALPTDITEDLA